MNKYHILSNVTMKDAEKIVSRLKGFVICGPVATPGYSAAENIAAGLVGIRATKETENKSVNKEPRDI